MTELLHRSAEFTTDGHTLTGYAVKWDTPSFVSDVTGTYQEAFARAAAESFTGEVLPLMLEHPLLPGARTSPIPLGQVSFESDDIGLSFRARVYDTLAGESALARVKRGELPDVSLSFYHREQEMQGDVTVRTKVRPIEMSLTRKAAHVGASVLAVRSAPATPALSRLRRRLILL